MEKNGKKWKKNGKKWKKCDFRIFGFSAKNRTFWEKIGLFGPFFRGLLEHFEQICPKLLKGFFRSNI